MDKLKGTRTWVIPSLDPDESHPDNDAIIIDNRYRFTNQPDEHPWIVDALNTQFEKLVDYDDMPLIENRTDTGRNLNNLDQMFVDPETNEIHYKIDGIWDGIETNPNIRVDNIDAKDFARFSEQYIQTDKGQFIVLPVEEDEFVPITIDRVEDTDTVRRNLHRAVDEFVKNKSNLMDINRDNIHQNIQTHIKGNKDDPNNNNNKELNTIINTNTVLDPNKNMTDDKQPKRLNLTLGYVPNVPDHQPRQQVTPVVLPAVQHDRPIHIGQQQTTPINNNRTDVPMNRAIPNLIDVLKGLDKNSTKQTIHVAPSNPNGLKFPVGTIPVPTPIKQNGLKFPVPVVTGPVPTPVKQPKIEKLIIKTPAVPKTNPYSNLPRSVIDSIAQERDIQVTGSNSDRANQLFEYDQILDDWIRSITSKNIENFHALTGTKLYVFGAIHGVTYVGIETTKNTDLVNYIRVSILLNQPNHPGRDILHSLVNNLNRNVLESFAYRLGIQRKNIKFISAENLRRAIIAGNTNHISLDEVDKMGTRYNLLMNHKYSNLLTRLYDVTNDNGWTNVAMMSPHPLESAILQLDDIPEQQIISTFGIVIPLSFANNTKQYIVNNIISYKDVVTRGNLELIPLSVTNFMQNTDLTNYLNKLTDVEIFNITGVYIPYSSRLELISGMVATLHTNGKFMYPTIRSTDRSLNKETVNLTDITDINVFMVCYGTPLKYTTYELDDLLGAFFRDNITEAMEFRRPENTRSKFPIKEIENLRNLLTCFQPTKEITDLMNRIDEGIIDAKEKIDYDQTALAQLNKLNKDKIPLIRDFLRQIFYIGMYMRRWGGPGNPFPLRADDTQTKVEPDAKVMEEIGKGMELLNQMGYDAKRFCLDLKICEYNGQGGIDTGKVAFRMQWDPVVKGTECIRMASTKFVGTGYHYLRSLFKETIPGMDVKALDRIM